jgi:hypothetical protein
MIGVLDHEMHIDREFRIPSDQIDNCRSEGNIIDEMSIHNVAVNPVSASLFDPSDFVSQSREVGGED